MSAEPYEECPSCDGSGLQLNTFDGEPDTCRECGGWCVVRARDEKGRFVGGTTREEREEAKRDRESDR